MRRDYFYKAASQGRQASKYKADRREREAARKQKAAAKRAKRQRAGISK